MPGGRPASEILIHHPMFLNFFRDALLSINDLKNCVEAFVAVVDIEEVIACQDLTEQVQWVPVP